MLKRLTIATLWFVAIWALGGVVTLSMEVPRALMLVPAAVAAAAWWIGLGRLEASAARGQPSADDRVRNLVDAAMTRLGSEA